MTKPKRRKGPRSPLVEEPHVQRIKAKLAEQGLQSFTEAAEKAGLALSRFIEIVRDGISEDPRVSTVEGLKKIGIFDLVKKRVRKTG